MKCRRVRILLMSCFTLSSCSLALFQDSPGDGGADHGDTDAVADVEFEEASDAEVEGETDVDAPCVPVACDDGEVCNGVEVCSAEGRCLSGASAPDGTACGAGRICRDGVCRDSYCGDGVTDPGADEVCDDGNAVPGDGCEYDCRWTCETDALCDDGALCNGVESCDLTRHACRPGVAAADGTPCLRPEGDGVCRGGLCAPIECGDGVVDPGEECDDHNLVPGDGCESDCTWTCEDDGECADGSTCNGFETCDVGLHDCRAGVPQSDGAECNLDGDPATREICLDGSCWPTRCGDGFVDDANGETCDDGNLAPGDGCENDCRFTCTTAADCANGELCDGDESCDGTTHRCLPGTPVPDGSSCTRPGGDAGECRGGVCAAPNCGNGTLDPGEDCDDGGSVAGDGCEPSCRFSCASEVDCGETPVDNPCTTDVCQANAVGQACVRSNNTDPCNDADACTVDDVCADGRCEGLPLDADGDGHGPAPACGGDCDDGNRDVHPGAVEACNAVDDDCDGATDDGTGMTCASGSSRVCTTGGGCLGSQTCSAACVWEACQAGTIETCNGLDDNCDGATDETFDCRLGAREACRTSCGSLGSQVCAPGCSWGPCLGRERCGNAADDDCDTLLDEGCEGGMVSCEEDAECRSPTPICNERWGICVVADCAGQPDFTPCETLTAPDRSYDICVRGNCVSPGCGTVSCNAPGPDWVPPDTDVRQCYDASAVTTCAGVPGDPACATTPYCGQDAQYGWDVGHAVSERFARTAPIVDEPVVLDALTGLLWQGCSAGKRGAACAGTPTSVTWQDALAYCENLVWGGLDDWRLPDRHELLTIVDFGNPLAPTSYATYFPATASYPYWTSSTYASAVTEAWIVHFEWGYAHHGLKTSGTNLYVRCVRRGPAPGPAVRFQRSVPVVGQPTVADATSGLVWQGCVNGRSGIDCAAGTAVLLDWAAALAYCEGLVWAGFSDWYLPNILELAGLVADGRTGPAIDPVAFPNTPAGPGAEAIAWSSSPCLRGTSPGNEAWTVFYDQGRTYQRLKVNAYSVRCVRRGS